MAGFVHVPRKQIVSIVAVLLFSSATRGVDFAGGTGEPNDPYQIATAEQLTSIGSHPNLLDKHFVLLNDIDLDPNLPGGRAFTKPVIAPSDETFWWKGTPFSGSFDGRGHSVKHLTFQKSYANLNSFIGLFGRIARRGVVANLRVEDADLHYQGGYYQSVLVAWNEGRIVRCGATGSIPGNWNVGILVAVNRGEIIDCWAGGNVSGAGGVGGLVGSNKYGIIVNSHASTGVRVTSNEAFNYHPGGGLVGASDNGAIVNCWATGDVWAQAGNHLGGLIGTCSAVIANSYATGNVSARGHTLGGLAGSAGTINDCYATGDVTATGSSLGGLIGNASGFISDSYAIGRVSAGQGSTDIGGLVGRASLMQIQGCFWDVETSGLSMSAGGRALTTTEMQDAATYVGAGWDFADEGENGRADLWFIPQGGGYPLLTVSSDAFEPHRLDGTGTPEDPYAIATPEDLDAINHHDLTACYRLSADIDLSRSVRNKPCVRYFDGRFDGAGRTIRGLTIRGGGHLGLFGDLGACASVRKLDISDANVAGQDHLGLLAGTNRGHIAACRAVGRVGGNSTLGLLTGWNEGTINDSYATGNVSSDSNFPAVMGGLIGRNIGLTDRCYAVAKVGRSRVDNMPDNLGGLVGSTQTPMGIDLPADLVTGAGEIHDSFFLIDTDDMGADNGLGDPLTMTQMKQRASFSNWDFEDIWTICEGRDYPRLGWEQVSCEP